MHKTTTKTLLGIGLLLLSSQSFANKVGAGIGFGVEFGGSDDLVPFPLISFEYELPVGILKNNQVGAQLDLVKSTSFDVGPIVRFNSGRDDSVEDDLIATLPEIESTVEIGGFIGSGITLSALGLPGESIIIFDAAAVADVGDGHGGVYAKTTIGLVNFFGDNLRVIPSVTFRFADDEYNQSFYGIEAGAASAQLLPFQAEGGHESTQLALVAIRTINTKWSVTGVLALNTIEGDAAESPITENGSDTNTFFGVSASYTF